MTSEMILVINCGSSSIKFSVIDTKTKTVHLSGLAECIQTADAVLHWREHETKQNKSLGHVNYTQALTAIMSLLKDKKLHQHITAVGHRVVHGGEKFKHSIIINDHILHEIELISSLAPLHNPSNIEGIRVMQGLFKSLPQVAVFDTSFHQTMHAHAYLYAIPTSLYHEQHIRRYGFHGISYRYVMQKAIELLSLPKNNHGLLIAHLGNGCSACAIVNHQSQDTTMGMTPLEGLIMGTRCGDIDPGVVLFLATALHMSLEKVNELLNKKSGLLGLSGLSMDMRSLENAALEGHDGARLAIEMFCYRLAKQLAGLATTLPQLDALIFTGGIGENSSLIRQKTLARLHLLNFKINAEHNLSHGKNNHGVISDIKSVKTLVIPTNEELLIAEDTFHLTHQAKT